MYVTAPVAVQELEGKMDETNATAQEVRNILKTMERSGLLKLNPKPLPNVTP
jgi:hypothetical protein